MTDSEAALDFICLCHEQSHEVSRADFLVAVLIDKKLARQPAAPSRQSSVLPNFGEQLMTQGEGSEPRPPPSRPAADPADRGHVLARQPAAPLPLAEDDARAILRSRQPAAPSDESTAALRSQLALTGAMLGDARASIRKLRALLDTPSQPAAPSDLDVERLAEVIFEDMVAAWPDFLTDAAPPEHVEQATLGARRSALRTANAVRAYLLGAKGR